MNQVVQPPIAENMLKYANYKEQHERLNKALKNNFYLEAIFIEYAIIEDRLTSILRYEDNTVKSKNGFVSIEKKINKVRAISGEANGLAIKYFASDFLDTIENWKNRRNPLIHALMKQQLTTEELLNLATEGQAIVKDLSRLSRNYKRAVERKAKKISMEA